MKNILAYGTLRENQRYFNYLKKKEKHIKKINDVTLKGFTLQNRSKTGNHSNIICKFTNSKFETNFDVVKVSDKLYDKIKEDSKYMNLNPFIIHKNQQQYYIFLYEGI